MIFATSEADETGGSRKLIMDYGVMGFAAPEIQDRAERGFGQPIATDCAVKTGYWIAMEIPHDWGTKFGGRLRRIG